MTTSIQHYTEPRPFFLQRVLLVALKLLVLPFVLALLVIYRRRA